MPVVWTDIGTAAEASVSHAHGNLESQWLASLWRLWRVAQASLRDEAVVPLLRGMLSGRMPRTPKLRCAPITPPFGVVLVEPEIPPNTGAVARTCAATQSTLHLVGPLGFDISDRAVKRAGIDYWNLVDLRRHEHLDDLLHGQPQPRFFLLSSDATRSYVNADYQPGDLLVFGRESVGLPRELLARHPERVLGIPTSGGVRSLNLSNAVAIVVYEALRVAGGMTHTFVETMDQDA